MKKKCAYKDSFSPPERLNRNRKSGTQTRFDRYLEFDAHPLVDPRLKWTPPQLLTEPLPTPDCPCCGKPIWDIATAIDDKTSGKPAHFECIITRIAGHERLEKGDSIAYIGGGRFGVVRCSNKRLVKILKIFEQEDNEKHRAEWRKTVSDHYSLT